MIYVDELEKAKTIKKETGKFFTLRTKFFYVCVRVRVLWSNQSDTTFDSLLHLYHHHHHQHHQQGSLIF